MIKPSMIQQNALTGPINFRNSRPLLALRGGSIPPVSPLLPTKFDPLIQTLVDGHLKIAMALVLAILLIPASKFFYDQLTSIFPWDQSDEKKTPTVQQNQDIFRPKLCNVLETISTAARLFLLVAAFDVLKITVSCFGVRVPQSESLTGVFAWAIYLLWGCRKISAFNLYVLRNIMVNTDIINDPRRLSVIHRLTDYGLLFFGIFIFYEVLNIEMGYSAKSLLAVFSFGTAAIALAMKDIITDFLNGVLLSASDRIYVGDFIEVDGQRKKVNRLGWLETKLRGSDNILYTIPNTQLMSSRLSNLSRVKTCQGTCAAGWNMFRFFLARFELC